NESGFYAFEPQPQQLPANESGIYAFEPQPQQLPANESGFKTFQPQQPPTNEIGFNPSTGAPLATLNFAQ
ncbi:2349_t:CDS:1, partial [Ambispora leptoticha]